MENIVDLGRKSGECATQPCNPGDKPQEVYYPTLYISDCPVEFPESGTMTVRFRLSRETEDHKNGKSSYDIDIMAITDIKADKGAEEDEPVSSYDKAGAALDKLKSQSSAKDKE